MSAQTTAQRLLREMQAAAPLKNKTLHVLRDGDGRDLMTCSGKRVWHSIGAVKNALRNHIEQSWVEPRIREAVYQALLPLVRIEPVAPLAAPASDVGPYRLASDDDGHWYVIPVLLEGAFEAWVDAADPYVESPPWAKPVGGCPTLVQFNTYEIP